jgi:hypothetical protein
MCKSVKFCNLTLKINPQSGTLSAKVVKVKKIRPDARQQKEKKKRQFPLKLLEEKRNCRNRQKFTWQSLECGMFCATRFIFLLGVHILLKI